MVGMKFPPFPALWGLVDGESMPCQGGSPRRIFPVPLASLFCALSRGEGEDVRGERHRRGRKKEGTALRERLEAVHTRVGEGREKDRGGTGARSGRSGGYQQQQRQWYVEEFAAVVRGGRTSGPGRGSGGGISGGYVAFPTCAISWVDFFR
ncbi:hypothetical protein Scep_014864 [Stephania cephalantha]|uniref:Uncharacterized protein n=1 Tax=Stephania cephalantha TaxID=152367 RepID=A0AAP0J3Z6_9MAGN